MDEIESVTAETWEALVAKAPGLVLVDFWGPQCEPCLAMKPQLRAVMDAFPEVKLYALGVTKARRLCIREKVLGLPALLLYREGKEIARHSGEDVTADTVRDWLGSVLGQPSSA